MRFEAILERMAAIHRAKNSDYRASYDLAPALLGIPAHVGLLVRMTDKLARACRLAQGHEAQVKDEALADTLTWRIMRFWRCWPWKNTILILIDSSENKPRKNQKHNEVEFIQRARLRPAPTWPRTILIKPTKMPYGITWRVLAEP